MKSGGAAVEMNVALCRKVLSCCLALVVCLLPLVAAGAGAEVKGLKVEEVSSELALRHSFTIRVVNLADWLSEGGDLAQLLLYIDGVAFKGLTQSRIEGDRLQFDLRRTDDNKEAWTTVLSRKGDGFFSRQVPVTVGLASGVQLPGGVNLKLIRIEAKGFNIFVGVCLVTIFLFVLLACRSDIIRNTGPQPAGVDGYGKPYRKTYSLARAQMAFWFFTIIICYVFIWLVTSDFSSLTPGVIGLMGISAATGVGAAVVDSGKRGEQRNQRRLVDDRKRKAEVEEEKLSCGILALEADVAAAPAAPRVDELRKELAARRAELAATQKEIAQAAQKIRELDDGACPEVSQGFLKDILSDDKGVSFHRFQISIWTIVLIVIFLGGVYDSLAMPTFDATLLALMGISNGTYIGFKMPDQQG